MDSLFINEAFDSAIKSYMNIKINSNEIIENSFLIMVLKMLSFIYDEIDIINPYILKNEKAFQLNIAKFGYNIDEYKKFKDNFDNYYKIEKENANLEIKIPNPYFVSVQKQLIDMFCQKKENYIVSDLEEKQFFELLYTTKTSNLIRSSYNYLTAVDIKEVENYFYEQMDKNEKKLEPPKKNNVLNIEAYEILNYSLTDIANMDSDSVDQINENVYSFFKVDLDAENKSDLLNEAIENYKKYNTRLTSGNGYVDILLVMGVVVTGIMILVIASYIIL